MNQRIRLKKEPQLDGKLEPFAFQREAIDFARHLEYSAIFFEQGLGKTKIAIDLIRSWLTARELDTVIVVTKKGLINNWQQEFETHSYLKPRILSSDKNANYYALNSPARVMLCNFETILTEARLEQFLKLRNVGVIIDESAKIKNPNSKLTQKFFELSKYFVKRVIMTGTPIANRPEDIWAQIYFLDSGASLGDSFVDFKNTVELSNRIHRVAEERAMFESAIEPIFTKIGPFTIRQTKLGSGLNLPNKVYKSVICEWEDSQLDLYEKIKEEERATLLKDGILVNDDSEEILKRIVRLMQVASNPKIIDSNYHAAPGKLSALREIIEGAEIKNEKCIVWTSFVKNAEWLTRELREHNAVLIHGGISTEDRNTAVEHFMKNDEVKVLVAVPAAAKEGLTLTVANNVVFWDRSLSLDDYLQAQDRIHRISQTKTCYIYNLIMKDSVDSWVDALLSAKEQVARFIQRDIGQEEFLESVDYSFSEIFYKTLGIGG